MKECTILVDGDDADDGDDVGGPVSPSADRATPERRWKPWRYTPGQIHAQ